MPTKPLDRLLFAQGGRCFFCQQRLSRADASIEHLVAVANGGTNGDENCVACCEALNKLLGRMSLKEKLRVVLNQKGEFKCPNGRVSGKATRSPAVPSADGIAEVVADLRKRGSARPRTLKALIGTVTALFKKRLSEHEVAALLGQMQAKGLILLEGTKVSYDLPPNGA
jgi:hypothetical protein